MNPYIAVSIVVAALAIYLLMDALFGGAKKPPEDLLSWRKDDGIEIGEPIVFSVQSHLLLLKEEPPREPCPEKK
jgi:hypothetical protein